MENDRKLKIQTRHSIGEWYGLGFDLMSPAERVSQARKEVRLTKPSGRRCPFQEDSLCNKKGGVCSLRLFEKTVNEPVRCVGSPITTCPNRFLENNEIFRWAGQIILGTKEPIVLSEIGFLDRLRDEGNCEVENDGKDFIGRIDNVLIHPERMPMDWCALEIQAVYFSGKAMQQEFSMLSNYRKNDIPFPAAHRRPDWRSSGPKRLLPQLQTKTPTIRTWGKKIAVVIDEPFFNSLVGLEREKHLSNAEILWFVVKYEPNKTGWHLVPLEAVYTKLDASVKALTGGIPLSKEDFEKQLRRKLALQHPGHRLSVNPR